MKTFDAVLSSTQVDKHGDVMSRQALESAAAQIKEHYITMGVEHDPRLPPVGRITDAWIEEGVDGIVLLKGRGEVFEESDSLPDTFDRTIIEREYKSDRPQIVYDLSYCSEIDRREIDAIADRFGSESRFYAKKALEPLSILTIGGSFVLGSIGAGFFRQIGVDAYKWLKEKLVALLRRQRERTKDQLLVFEFTVRHEGEKLLVQTILSDADDISIETFLKVGIYDLDQIPAAAFGHRLSRIVYFYEDGKLEFQYAVRRDGFPVRFLRR